MPLIDCDSIGDCQCAVADFSEQNLNICLYMFPQISSPATSDPGRVKVKSESAYELTGYIAKESQDSSAIKFHLHPFKFQMSADECFPSRRVRNS